MNIIKPIDCDNIEKFFKAFPQRESFLFEERNLELVRKESSTGEISRLIYPSDEFSFIEAMFEIVEEVIYTYNDEDKTKCKFLRECIIGRLHWKEAGELFRIRRRTYFAWRREILEDAIVLAIGRGILKIN